MAGWLTDCELVAIVFLVRWRLRNWNSGLGRYFAWELVTQCITVKMTFYHLFNQIKVGETFCIYWVGDVSVI